MNIEQAENKAKRAFSQALNQEDWPGALAVLTARGCTAKPSQAPGLKAAIRANPELLTSGTFVERPGGGKVEVTGACLEPDVDENYGRFVTDDWLTDVRTIEDEFPHFSTNSRVSYQLTHHVMFGDFPAAADTMKQWGVSIREDDFDGELARELVAQARNANTRAPFVRDGRSLAFRKDAQ